MASSKKPCSRCGCSGWVVPCEGCQDLFCIPHAGEHRNELSAQLNNLLEQSNHYKDICSHHQGTFEHPLFSQIDVWEHDTIAKIVQTAQIAREKLREIFEESNHRMKYTFEQFNEQLENVRKIGYFTEIHLKQLNQQLTDIKNQSETPCQIELISDNESIPIQLIKIYIQEENRFNSNVSISQITNSPSNHDQTEHTCRSIIEDLSITTNDYYYDVLTDESEIYFDPTVDYHLIIFQMSSTVQSELSFILSRLTSHQIEIFNEKEEEKFLNQLQSSSRQTTVFVDCCDRSLNQQNYLLDKISQIENVYFIYIRGISSENETERIDFFRRYSKIKAVFAHEQRLIVQWTIDTANELKRTGDRYVQNGENIRGRLCFQQGISLYKNLSMYLNEKRRIR